MSVTSFVDSVGLDVRHALRRLPRRPAFTFAAVLTLALGIGATTAIFSVVYSVLIKPLPYPSSGELVRIRHSAAAHQYERSVRCVVDVSSRTARRTERSPKFGFWNDGGETLTTADADGTRALAARDARRAPGARRAADARPLVHGAGARTRGGGARSR